MEWKDWLNPDNAFSDNGEKIKSIAKTLFVIQLFFIFISSGIGFLAFLFETLNGNFEFVWYVPFVIAITVLVAPFTAYLSLCFMFGFGQVIENLEALVKENKAMKRVMAGEESAPKIKAEPSPLAKNIMINSATDGSTAEKPTRRCKNCGNQISEDVCPICKFDNSASAKNQNTEVEAETVDPDRIKCPICKYEQPKTRKVCWHCGAKFTEISD